MRLSAPVIKAMDKVRKAHQECLQQREELLCFDIRSLLALARARLESGNERGTIPLTATGNTLLWSALLRVY
jgi:hypothetical protein